MTGILIDTNILLLAADGVRVFDELAKEYPHAELTVLEGTRRELKTLQARPASKQGRQARLAEALLDKQSLNTAPQSAIHVDTALLEEAERTGASILTLDRALQKRALDRGISVLTVRNRRSITPVTT